jgi:hypothetical protein
MAVTAIAIFPLLASVISLMLMSSPATQKR